MQNEAQGTNGIRVLPTNLAEINFEEWENLFQEQAVKTDFQALTDEEYQAMEDLKKMRLQALPEIEFESEWDEKTYEYMASYIVQPSLQWDCQGIVNATDPVFFHTRGGNQKGTFGKVQRHSFSTRNCKKCACAWTSL